MFFDIIDFNYLQLIQSIYLSVLISLVLLTVLYYTFRLIAHIKKEDEISKSIVKLILNITIVFFLTSTLLFWLDEKGFMIATAVISFSALIKNPVEKFLNPHI